MESYFFEKELAKDKLLPVLRVDDVLNRIKFVLRNLSSRDRNTGEARECREYASFFCEEGWIWCRDWRSRRSNVNVRSQPTSRLVMIVKLGDVDVASGSRV